MALGSTKLIVGNWKMNGSIDETTKFSEIYSKYLQPNTIDDTFKCVICPPFPLITMLKNLTHLSSLGAQTCSPMEDGAHTGDVSARMLSDLGCDYVIVGHSERRAAHYENESIISQQFARATENDLIPILCVGEKTRDENTEETLKKQIEITATSEKDFYIAYEPVWAIGGATAPPSLEHIRSTVIMISSYVKNSACMGVLYGGSVNSGNAQSICSVTDGLLIGGASLSASSWCKILDSLSQH